MGLHGVQIHQWQAPTIHRVGCVWPRNGGFSSQGHAGAERRLEPAIQDEDLLVFDGTQHPPEAGSSVPTPAGIVDDHLSIDPDAPGPHLRGEPVEGRERVAASPGWIVAGITGGAQLAVKIRVESAEQVASGVVARILPGVQQKDRAQSRPEVESRDECHPPSMKRPVQAVP